MDSSKIEVGDVFTCDGQGQRELVALDVDERFVRFAIDGLNYYPLRSKCRLVRKADPYHGITLPEPPAGYRLAKWGEVAEKAMYWEGTWHMWGRLETHAYSLPGLPIFAIPLDQPSPLKSWQFREVPWVQPEPKTLADCVEGVPVIVRIRTGMWVVKQRKGVCAYDCGKGEYDALYTRDASELNFVRYLDTPPQRPLSLDDVPDGRVVDDHGRKYWTDGKTWWRVTEEGCVFKNVTPPENFTITNYIAELRGPA